MIVVVPGFGLGRNKTRLTGRLAYFPKAYRASRCLRRFSWAYRASRYLRSNFLGPIGLPEPVGWDAGASPLRVAWSEFGLSPHFSVLTTLPQFCGR